MGFYGPKKTHIKRIFGRQRKGDGTTEEVREVYADVERTDSLPTVEWPGAQENQINLRWLDAPGEEGNPGRQLQTVRLTDPEDDSEDPDTFIEIPTISRMTMVRHPGAQEIVTTFQPSAADPVAEDRVTAREVAVRRIPFCETNVDDVLDETGYLAAGEDYERKLDTIDDTQHLDVEIVESYPSKVYNGPSPQDVKVSLDNGALKEAYAEPPNDARRPPLRLDPFQNIRNVCWGAGATEFPPDSILHQVVAESPDPAKISIVLFCYLPTESLSARNVPAAGGAYVRGVSLLMFGPKPQDNGDNASFSYIGASDAGVDFQISGTKDCQSTTISSRDFDGTPHFTNYDDTENLFPGSLMPDAWNCILLSMDTTSGRILDAAQDMNNPTLYYGQGTFHLNLNGVDCSDIPVAAGTTIVGLFVEGRADEVIPLEQDWTVALEGAEIAIPIQQTSTDRWPYQRDAKVAFGYVQVWTDRALDFSDPVIRAKFMKPDPDDPAKPRMVDPSIAQKAFGKPTFFFDGGPSKFETNQGSGGEFTRIGDLKSFRPAPPKASSGTTP